MARPSDFRFPCTRRRYSTLAAAIAMALFGSAAVHALPGDAVVVNGQASINTSTPNALLVNQTTDRAVINWQRFNIGNGERVEFAQPSSSSIVLNRVLGMDPSHLLGDLKANGQVFLINPNGIVFGRNARVDVGGLVGSTLALSNEDFLANRFRFQNAGSAGSIRNEGTINAGAGGIALIATDIANQGTLRAESAQVGLIAADTVLVDVEGDGLMGFRIEQGALAPRIEQLGRIEANAANLQARARGAFADTVLNMEGVVQARAINGRDGQIILDGGPSGITRVAGALDASALDATGGQIRVTGEKVLIDNGARIDASGVDGGSILVGGGAHGADASIANAQQVHVSKTASVIADGKPAGVGGTIILWSDLNTRLDGSLSTQGGAGGFIETSSAGGLQLASTPMAGPGGTWLIDPFSIKIVLGNGITNVSSSPFSPDVDGAELGVDQIRNVLDDGANVEVKTSGSGTGTGDITLSTDLTYSKLGTSSLLLNSAGKIILNGSILKGGASSGLNLTLQTAGGEIQLGNGTVNLAGGSFTATGPVVLNTNVLLTANGGVSLNIVNSVDNVGGGKSLTINSTGVTALTGAIGGTVPLSSLTVNNATVSATGFIRTTGAATFSGTSTTLAGLNAAGGISIIGPASLTGSYTTDNNAFSVSGATTLAGNTTVSTGSGTITFGSTLNGGAMLELTNTGNTQFNGAVGNTAALSSIKATSSALSAASTIESDGAVELSGSSVSLHGIDAAGAIALRGPTTLGGVYTSGGAFTTSGDTTLNATTTINAGSAAITLGGKVDGANALTLNSSGVTRLTGAVGSATPLTSLTIDATGSTRLAISGTNYPSLPSVTTTGNQNYGDPVTLEQPTFLSSSGGAISFAPGFDAAGFGFGARSGGGGCDTLSGSFSAGGSVSCLTLLGALTLSATADLTFLGTVDGGFALTVNGNANKHFSGVVGGLTPLASFTSSGTGTVTLGDVSTTGAILFSAPSTLGGIYATGGGSFVTTDSINLNATTTINAGSGAITFGGKVDGANALTLNSSGITRIADAVGSATALTSLSTDSTGITKLAISGTRYPSLPSITTTGDQNYGDAVTLEHPTFLSSASGTISFAPGFDSAGFGFGTRGRGGSCDTLSGSFSAGGGTSCLILFGAVTLTTTSDLTFLGTVDGGFALTVNGNANKRFSGVVGGIAPLASLTTSGTGTVTLGDVSTSGAIILNGPASLGGTLLATGGSFTAGGTVTLTANTTVSTATGEIGFADTIDGNHALKTSSTGTTHFAGAVGSSAGLTSLVATGGSFKADQAIITSGEARISAGDIDVAGISAGGTISLAGPTTLKGAYVTSNDAFSVSEEAFLSGNTNISTGAGTITFVGTLDGPNTLHTSSSGGTRFLAAVGATSGLAGFETTGPTAAGSITTSGGHIKFDGPVTLGGTYNTGGGAFAVSDASTLASNTLINAGGGAVGFAGAVDGAFALKVSSTAGATLAGTVGAVSALSELDISGPTTLAGVRTSGAITLNGPADLGGDYTSNGFSVAGPVTLSSDTSINGGSGSVAFSEKIDGAHALSVSSTGTTSLSGATGSTTALTSLQATGGAFNAYDSITASGSVTVSAGGIFVKDIAASDRISLDGPATLNGSYTTLNGTFSATGRVILAGDTRVSTGSGALTFQGPVDGPHAIQTSSTGGTRFFGAVGSIEAVTALTVSGPVSVGNIATTGGDINLNGAAALGGTYITGGGAFSAGDASTLAGDTTISAGSGAVRFDGSLDGAHALSVKTTSDTTLLGAVGSSAALTSLDAVSRAFTAKQVITTAGAVTLSGDSLELAGISAGGAIDISGSTHLRGTFTSTNNILRITGNTTLAGDTFVDTGAGTADIFGAIDGTHALDIVAARGIRLAGEVGANAALSSLRLNGPVTAGNITTTGAVDMDGPSTLSGNYTTRTGSFTATGPSTLSGDTRISSGSGIRFYSTIDGAHALSTSSTVGTVFSASLGSSMALSSLNVTGPVALADVSSIGAIVLDGVASIGGRITTAGGDYIARGATTLAGNTTINTGSGSIRFLDSINGPSSLSLLSTSGIELALVGNTGALAGLSVSGPSLSQGVRTTGDQSFDGRTSLKGQLSSDGGDISLTGPVTLTDDTTIRGGSIAIAEALDGSHHLVIDARDTLNIGGPIGAAEALSSLGAAAGRTIHLDSSGVVTNGAQDWNGSVWIGANTSVQSSGGSTVNFAGKVNSANASQLTVRTGGTTRFGQAIGTEGALGGLSTDAVGTSGETTVLDFVAAPGATSIRTTGDIAILDALQTSGPLIVSADGSFDAQNVANHLAQGSGGFAINAGSANIFSLNALELTDVRLTSGGKISTTDTLTVSGTLMLGGGSLGLVSSATPTVLDTYADPELNAAIAKTGLDLFQFGAAKLPELSAVIRQTSDSQIQTAAGTLLWVKATNGGTINLDSAKNTIHGGVSVTSGDAAGPSRFDPAASTTPVSFVRLHSDQLDIVGNPNGGVETPAAGILADAVKLTAERVKTGESGLIRARTPYIDAQGVPTSLPGIVFDILPAALTVQGYGTPASSDWIRLQVGDELRGGFVTLNPKGAFRPDFAVFAGGSTQHIPFYDGTNQSTEIQIYYNGALPQPANLSGALTAVAAVAEDARRLTIDEAVRPENITRRLRSGVIAEVGPGRAATSDSEGAALPETCEADAISLSCK